MQNNFNSQIHGVVSEHQTQLLVSVTAVILLIPFILLIDIKSLSHADG
jgi:hypothetical protein